MGGKARERGWNGAETGVFYVRLYPGGPARQNKNAG